MSNLNTTSGKVIIGSTSETTISITCLNSKQCEGLKARCLVFGGPVRFNANGNASDGRLIYDGEIVEFVLLRDSFNVLATNETDSIKIDLIDG